MRVGILTFSEVDNYGAMLQAYALQETVARLGYSPEVMRFPRRPYDLWHFKKPYRMRRQLRQYWRALRADVVYRRFRAQYYRYTGICSDLSELRRHAARFDAIIVGSDQVWSHTHAQYYGHESAYFLGFTEGLDVRRVSYAASVGSREEASKNEEVASRWLPSFHHLSVREEYSRRAAQRWSARSDVAVVADPTLLHDFSELSNRNVRGLPKKFILVYPVPRDGADLGAAALSRIRQQVSLPVVAIVCTNHVDFDFPGADIYVRAASPRDFVALFSRASYVLTNSFHGAIFALKNRPPFTVYLDPKTGSAERLYDFAERYGVTSRIVDNFEAAGSFEPIMSATQIDLACSLVNAHVARSLSFLRQSLS